MLYSLPVRPGWLRTRLQLLPNGPASAADEAVVGKPSSSDSDSSSCSSVCQCPSGAFTTAYAWACHHIASKEEVYCHCVTSSHCSRCSSPRKKIRIKGCVSLESAGEVYGWAVLPFVGNTVARSGLRSMQACEFRPRNAALCLQLLTSQLRATSARWRTVLHLRP